MEYYYWVIFQYQDYLETIKIIHCTVHNTVHYTVQCIVYSTLIVHYTVHYIVHCIVHGILHYIVSDSLIFTQFTDVVILYVIL